MFNEVLKKLKFKVLNRLFGNCKLFGLDKFYQECYRDYWQKHS